jgi:MOSC domain-containing protein YiiM
VDGQTPETCAECGFDARLWKLRDVVSLLGATGEWWAMAIEGVDREQLNTRPAPGVWSVLEYGVHTSLVLAMLRVGVELIVANDGVVLPPVPEGGEAAVDDGALDLDPARVVRDIEREAAALAALARDTGRDVRKHLGVMADGSVVQAEAALVHAAHDVSHHLMDVARGLASLDAGAPAQRGTVRRVNASDGGVPKLSIGGADVMYAGLTVDAQANRKHHGRPFQALCLWSSEVIDGLAAEGHPIEPGSAGENVTLEGLDWAALRPGALLRIGTVLAEVSFPATPCAKQTRWFADGDFERIDHERNPHLARWYAWVREPGRIVEGDAVVVRP